MAAHGYSIGLNDSDLCLCWRPETTRHFFLECFLFQEERSKLFLKSSQILPKFITWTKTKQLETILYGINLENEEPDPRNITIVLAVQNYILETKRFARPPPPPYNPPPLIT